ncbi:MAG: type II toxin-antitoxin system RelE/ParE family toxin [Clostridiales bacterium]|jgi:addiction module RelE/StbE family toxin|nr:type II toxin-antitoxin system RelE/ParE family toxin [Clostridiales bacterium]
MAKIRYSPEALRDLEKICDYISEQLKNPTAALNTVNAIQDKIDKLADFPLLGKPSSAIYYDVDMDDYRFLVCLNYLAFYRVEGDNVHIDRIMYGRRDYITILFGEPPQDEHE